ncbi:hypothetical protein JRG66_14995 [Salinimicrobium tongyeongense]|uniref:Uncharacterized protein n=1 Tax=Salinimicrobium tongyeongense TaxID=2809707 RepID=A0ABY6NQR2_9FLAO|nr:hypothetical protein [Salinimicrobium tongyeongense]UZH55234.1 hypothetical protein JRG66_14995 [Salinimicrobium tongyeongense]
MTFEKWDFHPEKKVPIHIPILNRWESGGVKVEIVEFVGWQGRKAVDLLHSYSGKRIKQ